MSPSSVLLSRTVFFEHDPAVLSGASQGGGESTGGASGSKRVPSRQEIIDAINSYLQIVEPDARFVDPPELSSLRILRPTKSTPPLCSDIISGFISSADKNLVALYAGPYRPGITSKGGYLIYDAKKNSFSAIPRPSFDSFRRLHSLRSSNPPEASLYIWQSGTREWDMFVACFPLAVCPPNHVFRADMCFSYGGSSLCWVDLFKGIVICDLFPVLERRSALKFSFIPLPRASPTYDRGRGFRYPLQPQEFRSMACTGGSIKFVTMDDYSEIDRRHILLTIWTLDIWASAAHRSLGLPEMLPSYPVLSMHEDNVVYLVFSDYRPGQLKVEYHGQYLLRVDTELSTVSHHPRRAEEIYIFSTENSEYGS
ncbi:hypothetical protein ZWY2020_007469 [Hordeum vulgare]|nr:hypothetical protein ZWY2020_007469 [Hordeum vulgare]